MADPGANTVNNPTPEQRWQAYWGDVADKVGEALWDTPPTDDTAKLLRFCEDDIDRGLQLVDVGCGNGPRSHFLAEHFPRVVGVDVSAAAIDAARQLYEAPNLEFRVLDAIEPAQASALHDELGDANVHVSAMFHSMSPTERALAAETVATLCGQTGRFFVEELGAEAEKVFAEMQALGGPPPAKVVKLFESGITPGVMPEGALEGLMESHGFAVVRKGTVPHELTETGPDGTPVAIALDCWLFARE
jgi:cyclopropane fatty-acyl-phospholipid synthase-like methyltransferase